MSASPLPSISIRALQQHQRPESGQATASHQAMHPVPHPPTGAAMGFRQSFDGHRQSFDGTRQTFDGHRQSFENHRQSCDAGHFQDPNDPNRENQDIFPGMRGFRGRKASIQSAAPSPHRRYTSGWEDLEIVKMLYTGTLPNNYFEDISTGKRRRKSEAIPSYAYLSKDFDRNSSTASLTNEYQESSKRRGVHCELRLQEAAWRHHQRMSTISAKARHHFKKVEEVVLHNEESDQKTMRRVEAASRKLYK